MSLLLTAAVLLMASSAPDRFDAAYGSAFDDADRVAVVGQDWVTAPDGLSASQVERVRYESDQPEDVGALRDALRAAPQVAICGCVCMVTLEIHLYRGDERLATFPYVGSPTKRDAPDEEMELADHEALLRWFDARGVDEPRIEQRERQRLAEDDRQAEALWLAAMPDALRPLWAAEWDAIRREPYVRARPAWSAALEAQVPDRIERAGALLAWFGSGRWGTSGAAAYEEMAEKLVLEVPRDDLAVAIQEQADVDSVLEGAARLACGELFTEEEVALDLPEHLAGLLRAHVLGSADEAKRACAEEGALAAR